jgi:CO/xanthine dehydrogenase FAD-binding subunit
VTRETVTTPLSRPNLRPCLRWRAPSIFPTMDFVSPRDLDEALAAKANTPEAQFLSGGTDLMVEVNLAHHRPQSVIGLRHVQELQEIGDTRIGAGVTWARLEEGSHRALAQLARTVGSPQIRAAGTYGGNYERPFTFSAGPCGSLRSGPASFAGRRRLGTSCRIPLGPPHVRVW